MPNNIFVVQTNAVDGMEDEYESWHANVHVPDALAVPGFVSARRFRISPDQRDGAGEYPYEYLTIYEKEGDPATALSALRAAVPNMYISQAMAADRMLHVFEQLDD